MKKVWEQFYRKRGRYYLLPHPNFNKVTSKLKAFKVHRVLDVGCGSGRHSIELARNGFKVTGVDFSKEAISFAKKWAIKEELKVEFVARDFHKKFSFRDDTFDAILAIDSICYDTIDSMKFTLKEVKRVLKKGGVLFVTLPIQVTNPLVTHLIFTKEEVKAVIEESFKIIQTFIDKGRYLCVFAIKE